jgi:hypothetical protein
VQIGPMLPTIASGDVHDLFVGDRVAMIAAIHLETGAIEMGKAGS